MKWLIMTLLLIGACGQKQKIDPNLSGSFEGSGEGRNGTITTRVTISEGKISDIVVIESQESPEYF
ncbi:MAG: FMN-binding protein, partial [Brevinema sp.]